MALIAGLLPRVFVDIRREVSDKKFGTDLDEVPIAKLKRTATLGLVASIAFGMWAFHFLLLAFIDLQLTTSFQQRITVLAPKITLQEEEEIRAAWANMRGKRDYVAINSAMEAFASKADIKLPPPLF